MGKLVAKFLLCSTSGLITVPIEKINNAAPVRYTIITDIPLGIFRRLSFFTAGFKIVAIRIEIKNKSIISKIEYKNQRNIKKNTVNIIVLWEISIFLGIAIIVPTSYQLFHVLLQMALIKIKPFNSFILLKPCDLSLRIIFL